MPSPDLQLNHLWLAVAHLGQSCAAHTILPPSLKLNPSKPPAYIILNFVGTLLTQPLSIPPFFGYNKSRKPLFFKVSGYSARQDLNLRPLRPEQTERTIIAPIRPFYPLDTSRPPWMHLFFRSPCPSPALSRTFVGTLLTLYRHPHFYPIPRISCPPTYRACSSIFCLRGDIYCP